LEEAKKLIRGLGQSFSLGQKLNELEGKNKKNKTKK